MQPRYNAHLLMLPVILLACTAIPATAEDNGETATSQSADAPQTTVCELHAWPANSLRSTYHGWFHGGITDGAVQGRDGYRKLPPDPLSTAEQAARLRASPLAEILSLKGYKLIVHDDVLTSAQIRKAKGPHVPDAPPCYAELVTDDIFFQQDFVDGRFLKALFRFRQFDGSDTPTRSFGAYSQRRLKLFPPKEEAEQEASFRELADQYSEALGEFGKALNPPPKRKMRDN
ncbi:hypothetical protein SZ64_16940 [Erythrobacter sp. SG61-1L]|uniref:hypothetical protein n=1 Tax=Erythrobacter sp. SG61-1L TaxID=1603897 RepID=UPI0006C93A2B|nr:hypothetical protein [Erythrobacter sp. SG61-1L]KPL69632.1 hypothetical protein SZ64_16940 [Erythrobacter sp. SG61-1L]